MIPDLRKCILQTKQTYPKTQAFHIYSKILRYNAFVLNSDRAIIRNGVVNVTLQPPHERAVGSIQFLHQWNHDHRQYVYHV